jgi:hypothetical protein
MSVETAPFACSINGYLVRAIFAPRETPSYFQEPALRRFQGKGGKRFRLFPHLLTHSDIVSARPYVFGCCRRASFSSDLSRLAALGYRRLAMNDLKSEVARAVADVVERELLGSVGVPAPPERVFRALASKEITQWRVRAGVFDTREWTGDLRVGGRWRASGIVRATPMP